MHIGPPVCSIILKNCITWERRSTFFKEVGRFPLNMRCIKGTGATYPPTFGRNEHPKPLRRASRSTPAGYSILLRHNLRGLTEFLENLGVVEIDLTFPHDYRSSCPPNPVCAYRTMEGARSWDHPKLVSSSALDDCVSPQDFSDLDSLRNRLCQVVMFCVGILSTTLCSKVLPITSPNTWF